MAYVEKKGNKFNQIAQGLQTAGQAVFDVAKFQEDNRRFDEKLQLDKQDAQLRKDEFTFKQNVAKGSQMDRIIDSGLNILDPKARKAYFERMNPFIEKTSGEIGVPVPAVDALILGDESVRNYHQKESQATRLLMSNKPEDIKKIETLLPELEKGAVVFYKNPSEGVNRFVQLQQAVAQRKAAFENFQSPSGKPLSPEALDIAKGLDATTIGTTQGGKFVVGAKPQEGGKINYIGGKQLEGLQNGLARLRSQVGIEDQLNELETDFAKSKGNALSDTGPLQGRVNNVLSSFGLSTDNYQKFRTLVNQGTLEEIKRLSGVQYTEGQLKFMKSSLPTEVRTPKQLRAITSVLKQAALGDVVENANAAGLSGQVIEPNELKQILMDNAAYMETGPAFKTKDLRSIVNRANFTKEEMEAFIQSLPTKTRRELGLKVEEPAPQKEQSEAPQETTRGQSLLNRIRPAGRQ